MCDSKEREEYNRNDVFSRSIRDKRGRMWNILPYDNSAYGTKE